MQDGMIETHIVNRSYEMTSLADDRSGEPKLVRYLVSVEIDRRIRDGQDLETEFLSSTARVAARPIGEQGLAPATLDIETPGDEVAVSGPFLIVTRWGCCALQSSHAAYSLLSGARLFSATGEGGHGDWVTLGSRHRPDQARYVAAHVAPTLSDAEELGEDETHVIAITYAAGAGARQRLIVTLQSGRNSDEVLNWLPKLSWVTSDQPGGTDHVFVTSEAPAEETYTGFHLPAA
jgi:hypothetical protein